MTYFPSTRHFLPALFAVLLLLYGAAAYPAELSAARGEYLVRLGGCMDCHTPGNFLGRRDPDRVLAGSEVGFEIPGLGTFYGPNLTPDAETGIGAWSREQIADTLRTDVRPDGRALAPVMSWGDLAHLSRADARAIADYLKSLPPLRNRVPGPFGPGQPAAAFVMRLVPPTP